MGRTIINVVIPYLAEAAQGRELELAVAGWRQHFKERFRIVIVGDNPGIAGPDIVFIECPRIPDIKGQYRAHLDHVNKFRTVRKRYPKSEGFIYTCDDIYAVRDFTLEDVMRPKVHASDIDTRLARFNRWTRDNAKTKKILQRDGLPTANWVCHLPVWYDWDKLLTIYDRYDCDCNSYVVENLYFNTYCDASTATLLGTPEESYRHRVWRRDASMEAAAEAVGRVTWIVNSCLGWSPVLESILADHYGFSK